MISNHRNDVLLAVLATVTSDQLTYRCRVSVTEGTDNNVHRWWWGGSG